MDRFNNFYIICTLIDLMNHSIFYLVEFNDSLVDGSVSIVTHKPIELNKICVDAILKALSTVMNENRRNKVFTGTKQLKMRECSKDISHSCYFHFNVSNVLHFEGC